MQTTIECYAITKKSGYHPTFTRNNTIKRRSRDLYPVFTDHHFGIVLDYIGDYFRHYITRLKRTKKLIYGIRRKVGLRFGFKVGGILL